MMFDRVEAAARAFYEQDDPDGWDSLDYESKESRLIAAKAALAAADEVEPMVPKRDYDEALKAFVATQGKLYERADSAARAAKELAEALHAIKWRGKSPTLQEGVVLETLETDFARGAWCQLHAAEALTAHPEYDPERTD